MLQCAEILCKTAYHIYLSLVKLNTLAAYQHSVRYADAVAVNCKYIRKQFDPSRSIHSEHTVIVVSHYAFLHEFSRTFFPLFPLCLAPKTEFWKKEKNTNAHTLNDTCWANERCTNIRSFALNLEFSCGRLARTHAHGLHVCQNDCCSSASS